MFDLVICGLAEVRYHLDGWATKAISLINADHGPRFPYQTSPTHLVLTFDDAENEREAMLGYVLPSEADVQAILDFGRTVSAADRLLIHCHAGVGRSTAAAMAVLVQHGMSVHDAISRVETIRRQMYPNQRVVDLADRLLGLDGTFSAAVHGWKAGAKDINFDIDEPA